VKILNAPVAAGFRESVRYGEQNLYTRAKELVGDLDSRTHESSVQLRAIDADMSAQGIGLGVLVALTVSSPSCPASRSRMGGQPLSGAGRWQGTFALPSGNVAAFHVHRRAGRASIYCRLASWSRKAQS
jgi:ATP-dependent Lon protease